jgi:hypothetical protein
LDDAILELPFQEFESGFDCSKSNRVAWNGGWARNSDARLAPDWEFFGGPCVSRFSNCFSSSFPSSDPIAADEDDDDDDNDDDDEVEDADDDEDDEFDDARALAASTLPS